MSTNVANVERTSYHSNALGESERGLQSFFRNCGLCCLLRNRLLKNWLTA
jgi:hypothetical protein